MKKVLKGTPRKNIWIMTYSCEEDRKMFSAGTGYSYHIFPGPHCLEMPNQTEKLYPLLL